MKKIFHESAAYHLTGEAVYIEDINQNNVLIGHLVPSKIAKGKIISFDISDALKVEGIHAILSYKDIPGKNNIGAIIHDEESLVSENITFIGQTLFLIAADTKFK